MVTILLIFVFIRPFISSLAFPYTNFFYSLCLLLFLIIWVIRRGASLKEIGNFKYPLILFFLSLIISLTFSQNKLNSLGELYKYVSCLSLFLIAVSLKLDDKMRSIRIIVLAAFIISLWSIYQYLFGFQHLSQYLTEMNITNPFILDYVERKRVFSPFVTPNLLGGYLAMIIPLALINKKGIWLAIFIFSALLLTQSLGALISLFLGLTIYFYLLGRIEKRMIISILGLLTIIAVVFVTRSSAQKEYFQPIFSMVIRLGYWRDTLKIIGSSPWVGIGLGNFDLSQSRYTHNSYLQIWAEMGIMGILSFLWFAIAIIKRDIENIRGRLCDPRISCLLAANLIFLIHNFIDFSFFLPEIAPIWWLIIGLALKP